MKPDQMANYFTKKVQMAVARYQKAITLKQQQTECLELLYSGKDVIANLPTGFGKSLIYNLLPIILSSDSEPSIDATVLVVCPLNVIQSDQSQTLKAAGISSCMLNHECQAFTFSVSISRINQFIISHIQKKKKSVFPIIQ